MTIVRVLEEVLQDAPNSKPKTEVYQLCVTTLTYIVTALVIAAYSVKLNMQPIARCKYEYKGNTRSRN